MPAVVSLWDLTCANTTSRSHVLSLTHSLTNKVQQDKTISWSNTLKLTGIAVLSWSHTWQAVYSVCCQSTQSKVFWPKHFRIIKYQTQIFFFKACFAKCLKNALLSPNVSVMICFTRNIKWSFAIGVLFWIKSPNPDRRVWNRVCVCVGTLRMSVRMRDTRPGEIRNPAIITKKTSFTLWCPTSADQLYPKVKRHRAYWKMSKGCFIMVLLVTKKVIKSKSKSEWYNQHAESHIIVTKVHKSLGWVSLFSNFYLYYINKYI